jgi:hypothetical protein
VKPVQSDEVGARTLSGDLPPQVDSRDSGTRSPDGALIAGLFGSLTSARRDCDEFLVAFRTSDACTPRGDLLSEACPAFARFFVSAMVVSFASRCGVVLWIAGLFEGAAYLPA